MGERFIFSVKYSASAAPSGGVRAASGFLRYIEHRDKHNDKQPDRRTAGLLRYVAHRDHSSSRGEFFGPKGRAGALERREMVAHVRRSLESAPSRAGRPPKSVYRFVLSPERADGLDLKGLAMSVLAQLEKETGSPLPPWLAAVHRNTAHPHVHIVMAARREVGPGKYRELRITKERLAHMKAATGLELAIQRGDRKLEHERRLNRRPGLRAYRDIRQRDQGWKLLRGVFSGLARAARAYKRQIQRDYEQHMLERGLVNELER